MGTFTAQNVLDENDYSTDDISLANVEREVNNAIHYVELETGLALSDMATQTVTLTDAQEVVVKLLAGLLIQARKDEGTVTTTGGVNIQSVLNSPRYALKNKLVNMGINRLRGRSFERT